jgi:hypothetical protein
MPKFLKRTALAVDYLHSETLKEHEKNLNIGVFIEISFGNILHS